MDKTASTVRNMLTAIEAPLYDIGVLSDRGMLPGLDGIPAAAVLDRLSLLKYRNVRGSHIYVGPSGEHRFTVLDDLNETTLARLAADGFNPCAVVETSAGRFFVNPWPRSKLLAIEHRKPPCQTMATRGPDKSARIRLIAGLKEEMRVLLPAVLMAGSSIVCKRFATWVNSLQRDFLGLSPLDLQCLKSSRACSMSTINPGLGNLILPSIKIFR
jgi:hypothetical protein